MFSRTRTQIWSIVAIALLMILSTGSVQAAPQPHTYRVTITNLTDGQPLTPPVVATHRQSISFFEIGETASAGIQAIAENGTNGPLLAALADNKHVWESLETSDGPLVPEGTPGSADFRDSVTFTISAAKGNNYLSFAAMLICTNDGFTGLDSLRLPKKVGDSTTAYADGYDAGTEINTEDFADIVPPCQGLIGVSSGDAGTGASNPALAENGVIVHHPNILGGDDLLPAVHGWSGPVAKVTVERVD